MGVLTFDCVQKAQFKPNPPSLRKDALATTTNIRDGKAFCWEGGIVLAGYGLTTIKKVFHGVIKAGIWKPWPWDTLEEHDFYKIRQRATS